MFEKMRKRFVIIVMSIVAFVTLSVLLQATGNALLFEVVMLLLFYTVLPVWICSYYFKKHSIRVRRIFFVTGIARWLLPILGITVLLLTFSTGVYWLMLRGLAAISSTWIEIALIPAPFPEELWYQLAFSFIIVILAPIAEEFVFRGVLLHRLMNALGLWKGILLTSLIFSVFHINILGSFLFAVLASLLYLKTRTLLAPILLHIFNNSLVIYQLYFDPYFPEWLTVTSVNDIYTKAGPNLIALITSLILLLIVINWLARRLNTFK